MAYKSGDKTEQITIRISEKLKAAILLQSLLDRKNMAEWVRDVVEAEIQRRETKEDK